jgi:hypothetical protein
MMQIKGSDGVWHNEDGATHRIDGPAVIRKDGTQEWYYDGLLHRTDGPAIESPDGSQVWWFLGKLHRLDGPAVIYSDGSEKYYIHGVNYHFEEWDRLRKLQAFT